MNLQTVIDRNLTLGENKILANQITIAFRTLKHDRVNMFCWRPYLYLDMRRTRSQRSILFNIICSLNEPHPHPLEQKCKIKEEEYQKQCKRFVDYVDQRYYSEIFLIKKFFYKYFKFSKTSKRVINIKETVYVGFGFVHKVSVCICVCVLIIYL